MRLSQLSHGRNNSSRGDSINILTTTLLTTQLLTGPTVESADLAEVVSPNAQTWRQQAVEATKENEELRKNNAELVEEIDRLNETAWQPFEATAYTAFCDSGCIGITRAGIDVSNTTHHNGLRVIATDPSVVPMWSIVELRFADGSTERAIAVDTGGAIKGRRIDYLIGNKADALKFGRQQVSVKIIERGAK